MVEDTGWNSVILPVEHETGVINENDIFDGKLDTSVRFTNGMKFDAVFERRVSCDEVMLYSTGEYTFDLSVYSILDGVWKEIYNGKNVSLNAGWNRINFVNSFTADRLRFATGTNDEEGIRLAEVIVRSLPVSRNRYPRVAVTYPVDGEYYGRDAFIEGFTVPVAPEINIEGKYDERNAGDGSFSLKISKDEITRYKADADNVPWNPVIYSKTGSLTFSAIAPLYKNYYSELENDSDSGTGTGGNSTGGQLNGDGSYTTTIYPDSESVISFDGLTIRIPKGAVDKATEISITPLSKDQLPDLDPGMINVTSPAAGYRFLPHGVFNNYIQIYFQYAREKLKTDQVDNDVFMYYHDESAKRWKRLERIKVEPAKTLVTSRTNHFTDIINATISVPEHPDPLSFNPNTIKDLKAGDPSTGITMIESPKMSNTGEAALSFPIEIPKGRKGMQPQLALRYTSGVENSWCGTGWNLTVPSVSIETRWGVPRYADDANNKTIYLLNGMQLVEDPSETGKYRTRVEGAFQRILRKTASDGKYYWEVTEKNGTKYCYGLTAQSRLSNYRNSSQVFQWNLERVIDTNGNTINYSYIKDTNANPGDREGWTQLYLSEINYTGYNNDPGRYRIVFNTTSPNVREDQFSTCKPGFQVLTRYYLTSIDVYYSSSLVKRYGFEYGTTESPYNLFGKLSLTKICQYGAGGTKLAEHVMEYYNDLDDGSGGIRGFASESGSDVVKLGSNEGGEMAGNFSFSFSPFNALKYLSLGGQGGINRFDTTTKSVFLDIDGDNLPDEISSGFKYRKNLGKDSNGNYVFETEQYTIEDAPDSMGKDTGNGYTIGAIINFVASICKDRNKGKSETEGFFSDVNGDGLIDFVDGGTIHYNRLEQQDDGMLRPKFGKDVPVYSSPVGQTFSQGDAYLGDIVTDPNDDNLQKEFYLDDPIRMWRAPMDGAIRIAGQVSLDPANRPTDDFTYSTDDGVEIFIQWNKIVLYDEIILSDDWTIHDFNISTYTDSNDSIRLLNVQQGDEIYFRVNSRNDGAYDIVNFDPTITYVSRDTEIKDENGMPVFEYNASSEFNIAGKEQAWTVGADGIANFYAKVVKTKPTSDDVVLEIVLQEVSRETQEEIRHSVLNMAIRKR